MCNGRHRYLIDRIPGEMPKLLSYSGEGCSLSFHIPPVFQGLVLWFVYPLEQIGRYNVHNSINISIRNKSNGQHRMFEDNHCIKIHYHYDKINKASHYKKPTTPADMFGLLNLVSRRLAMALVFLPRPAWSTV
jgi:hypothetical protein